jgi:hypothetical protein
VEDTGSFGVIGLIVDLVITPAGLHKKLDLKTCVVEAITMMKLTVLQDV